MPPIDMVEHPEGGRFREMFRSSSAVQRADGESRTALTHIYFSLAPGEVSRFHRVAADEVWNLYRGAGVILYLWDGTVSQPERIVLSAEETRFCHVVPAGIWQAAEPVAGPVLVGCTVAPGFEFADFTLFDPDSEDARLLSAIFPGMTRFIMS